MSDSITVTGTISGDGECWCLEVDDAYNWYEQQTSGLGTDFLNEIEDVLNEIRTNPARFGFAEDDIREGIVQRFPYAIYYRVTDTHIRVLAVFHTSRDPNEWRFRT